MNQIKKIIQINLVILFIYTLVIQLVAQVQPDQHYQGILVLVLMMYTLIAQVGINLLLAIYFFFKDNSEQGKTFLLSSLIVLLVGFSCCWGSALLTGQI